MQTMNEQIAGLRVRVGITWAVPSASELQYNAASARMVYGGRCVAAAKAIADVAAGGQVLLSGAALERWEAEGGAGAGARTFGSMVLHLATYALPRANSGGQRGSGMVPPPPATVPAPAATASNGTLAAVTAEPAVVTVLQPQVELLSVYWLTSQALSPRLAVMPPLRPPAEATSVQDVYGAPVGHLSYATVRLPAAAPLLAWDHGAAVEGLALFRETAAAVMSRMGSQGGARFLLSAGMDRGKARAAFSSAAAAVWWALELRSELLHAPWPQAGVQHLRELPLGLASPPGDGSPRAKPSQDGTVEVEAEAEEELRIEGPVGHLSREISESHLALPSAPPAVLLRGPRMHAAICTGWTDLVRHEATHSLAYTGRPVSAAAKLSAAAASGQVLCCEATQREAAACEQLRAQTAEDEAVGPWPEAPQTHGGGLDGGRVSARGRWLVFVPAAEGVASAARRRALAGAFVCG
ncbi:hypothetical protein GPECTOR_17g859 [Gonium pectorale]|uniref:Guanylate cyclase domain-containing protein n=1 Tax=Gonium pectorale TaxID=33097 RepID=A0A150GKA3_GONPE|nr:hypothetical protein GPECTOR_17g859 [Gonium pectorale]|eukprot:KXZ50222.1 hypothetical protein GPECTOR_17g859 [Gonium pectorale]